MTLMGIVKISTQSSGNVAWSIPKQIPPSPQSYCPPGVCSHCRGAGYYWEKYFVDFDLWTSPWGAQQEIKERQVLCRCEDGNFLITYFLSLEFIPGGVNV